jgi:hypothetical protein
MRTMDIVEELLAGVRHSDDELNEKLAGLYTFVYMRLMSVYVNGDKQMMAEALRVLEFQRETWRQAVDKLATETKAEAPAAPLAKKVPAPKPHLGGGSVTADIPVGGLSFEA